MVRHSGRKRKGNKDQEGGKSKENENKKSKRSSNRDFSTYKEHVSRLIDLSSEGGLAWYQYETSLLKNKSVQPSQKSSKGGSMELASTYREMADEIFRREIQISSGGKDEQWIESTIRKGTLKDRIAAMTVIVSQDPVHKLHALDGLLNMACGSSDSGGQNSRVAQLAAEALQDLFINVLLPADRKLKTLDQRDLQPFGSQKSGGKTSMNTLSPRILLLWRFEEMIKEKFGLFIRNYLSRTLQEGLEITKIAALRTAASLLRSVPEGESQVLVLLVNKLGDPQRKTAAAAGHELRAVLKEHPNMQVVIAREVQQLAHRPHLSPRALYNCVAFLNQLQLDRDETDEGGSKGAESVSLPAALINTYFKLFEVAMRASNERGTNNEVSIRSRLLQALLIGVNRAHPYLKKRDKHMDEHIDELYRVLHTASPGAATQALTLLFHITVGSPTTGASHVQVSAQQSEESLAREDRFYRALFAAVSSAPLLNPGKHSTMFFNILYKSMKFDSDCNRVVAFAKRLLASSLHCTPPCVGASIFVLNEVAKQDRNLQVYLDESPEKRSAATVLDTTKREPRVAFTGHGEDGSNADARPSSWELSLVSHHYHPSVSKFANNAGYLEYHGNPIQDFSLAPFLDKFAYRNPKASKERTKITGGAGQRRTFGKESMDGRIWLPVNDPGFLKQKETEVQDEFFRKFFAERASRMEAVGTRKRAATRDEDAALDYAESYAVDDVSADFRVIHVDTHVLQKQFPFFVQQFAALESRWESDSEEEAFVDSLAEKLLVDNAGGAPVDVDDDPDWDDWSDKNDDNDADVDIDGEE